MSPVGSPYRRDVIVSSLSSVAIYGTGLVTGPILARALGPGGRGDVAAVIAPVTVLTWILACGLPLAAAYFVDNVPERDLLATCTAFGIVVGVPVCGVLWLVAPAYLAGHSPVTTTWARTFLLFVPLSVGMSAALEVRRRVNPGLGWNSWRSVPIIVPAVGTVVLALAGRLVVASALALYLLGGMLPLILLWSRLRGARPWPRPSMRTLRVMFPYAWRAASTVASTSVTGRLDQVVLVVAVPSEQLGLYAVATMVASVTNPLTSGVSLALFGHLRGETSTARARTRFRRSVALTLLLSSSVAVMIGIFAPIVLGIAFGSAFAPATTALRLLLPGAVAFDVMNVIESKLYSDGRPGEASRAAVLAAVVTVGGVFAFVPRYGIEGAAVVTSVAFVAQALFLGIRLILRGRAGDGSEPVGPVTVEA